MVDQSDVDFILKVTGGLTAFTLFIIGFVRYKKDQNWKRKEFISREIKEFLKDKVIHNCLLMLDWDTRYIELYPNHPDYDKRFSKIGRKETTAALIPHGKLKRKYTKDESIIRDNFDYFFDELSKFEHFIESGLLSQEDIYPYLKYWFNVISNDLPEPLKSSMHHYIIHYEYHDIISLLRRFNMTIEPKLSIEQITKKIESTTGNNV